MREELTINRLGHLGDGIADGPVFVPRALPGEVVSGVREADRLTDIRIETPSDARVAPPCRHYRGCGGCALQHASDGFVAEWKQGVVRAALAAQGIEARFRPMQISPPATRRRATLAARRTKKGAMTGFYGRGSDAIVEIPDCRLLHPDLMAGLPVAEALAVAGTSRKAALAVTLTRSLAGLDVAVRGGKALDGPLRAVLGQLAQQFDLARLAWEDEIVATLRPPEQRFGPALVVPPPGAFLQATEPGEAALVALVREVTGGARRIADLFAGSGTFSLPMAAQAEIHAVEGDPAMLRALDRGWREAQGLKRVTTESRDLFRRPLMADELAGFDAVVLDPPRAGAEAQVAELAHAAVPVIAHVSCNPVSFARDARTLIAAGYEIGPVQVVDQFRWSPHVEIAAGFFASDRSETKK